MKKLVALFVAVICGFSAFARDAVWNSGNGWNARYYWPTLSNWLVEGATPDIAPTNAADNVFFPNVKITNNQVVRTGWGDNTSQEAAFTVGSVTGDSSTIIMHGSHTW